MYFTCWSKILNAQFFANYVYQFGVYWVLQAFCRMKWWLMFNNFVAWISLIVQIETKMFNVIWLSWVWFILKIESASFVSNYNIIYKKKSIFKYKIIYKFLDVFIIIIILSHIPLINIINISWNIKSEY